MPHRFPIKLKTAAMLSVPLVMLVGVASYEVADSTADVGDVREQADLATAAIGPTGLVNALMNERNYTSLWLFGTDTAVALPVSSLDEARAETDESVAAFRDMVTSRGNEAAQAYAPVLDALAALEDNRAAVDGYDGPKNITIANPLGDEVWATYSTMVTALADATTELAYDIEDDELRRGVQLVDLAARQVDRISNAVRAISVYVVQGGGTIQGGAQYSEAVIYATEGVRFHERIIGQSTGAYAELGEELRAESDDTQLVEMSQEWVASGRIDLAAFLSAVSIDEDESYYGFMSDVADVVRARADTLTGDAEAERNRILAVAAVVLLLAATATPLVSMTITRPLRSLTRQAKDMAEHRLPAAVRSVHEVPLGEDVEVPELAPVTVRTRDEVADVAGMLNAVQTTALDLAVEQAVLRRNVADAFVSLARRYQGLLARQLDYITELEASETRPDVLADLYLLDHQAIRMRRNAESVLVLAGAESPRHGSPPAQVIDVVRAALGEVADYERVSVKGVQPAVVIGPVVADLAHLLAELIDNALRYSPAGEPVEVRGHGRDEEGYALAVIDGGPGMSPEELARANRRLANAEAHTVAPSTYLGHYVTAALAGRHGITVQLHASSTSATGVSAIVRLPPSLLLDEAAAERLGRRSPAAGLPAPAGPAGSERGGAEPGPFADVPTSAAGPRRPPTPRPASAPVWEPAPAPAAWEATPAPPAWDDSQPGRAPAPRPAPVAPPAWADEPEPEPAPAWSDEPQPQASASASAWDASQPPAWDGSAPSAWDDRPAPGWDDPQASGWGDPAPSGWDEEPAPPAPPAPTVSAWNAPDLVADTPPVRSPWATAAPWAPAGPSPWNENEPDDEPDADPPRRPLDTDPDLRIIEAELAREAAEARSAAGDDAPGAPADNGTTGDDSAGGPATGADRPAPGERPVTPRPRPRIGRPAPTPPLSEMPTPEPVDDLSAPPPVPAPAPANGHGPAAGAPAGDDSYAAAGADAEAAGDDRNGQDDRARDDATPPGDGRDDRDRDRDDGAGAGGPHGEGRRPSGERTPVER